MRNLNIFSIGLSIIAGVMMSASVAIAAEGEGILTERDWTFSGPFGYFDKAELQRGFQVYREVCSNCHGLDYIAFRHLAGLGYNEDEIKAIAAEYEVVDGPDAEGDMFTRPGIPADKFPNPFANENAARAANGGAYPPDLSLTIKSNSNGANYLYSLLISYKDAPIGTDILDGMHYNEAFSGNLIAMPQPLYGDDVTFAGEGDTTIEGLAADVTAFLAWTSEPEMERRKRIGIAVMIFLLVMCFVSYGSMRYVWSDVKK
jgi:ubiquinol-cytochrome c reductase cytochrome c1 subunit